jgi:hypothetical protein
MPYWKIDFGDDEPTECDLAHIAHCIEKGYTSGFYHGEKGEEE